MDRVHRAFYGEKKYIYVNVSGKVNVSGINSNISVIAIPVKGSLAQSFREFEQFNVANWGIEGISEKNGEILGPILGVGRKPEMKVNGRTLPAIARAQVCSLCVYVFFFFVCTCYFTTDSFWYV